MSLGGSDEDVVLSYFDFESLLVVAVYYFPDFWLINIFESPLFEVLYQFWHGHIAAGFDSESFFDCSVSEYFGHGF